MDEPARIIGTLSQKELIKLYSTYISTPKANFFTNLSLGMIQGHREGIYIHALEGLRKSLPPLDLIDCRTSGGVFNLGHRHPQIIQALKEGIDGGLDIGDHHLLSEQRALLAQKLAEILPPGITKTQFCVGGGEAIELAIKIARAYTQRKKVISATIGYHGVTGFALAAGHTRFKTPFLWDLPDFVQITFGSIKELRAIMDNSVACVIFETIPATGGILIPPAGFFPEVRALCDKFGAVMIADEVQAGLARTGQMWGIYGGLYPEEKIIPDIIVLAKGMSAGMYPLATCSYKPQFEKIFDEDPFLHISTTGGSELGCYVARKMLNIIAQDSFLSHIREMGSLFEKCLKELQEKYSKKVLTDVRGRGLMWALEFPSDRYGVGFTLAMIQNGILADYCGNNEKTIKLMPPLIVESQDINEIISRLDKAMMKVPMPKD